MTEEDGEEFNEVRHVELRALDEVPLLWWDVSPRPLPPCDIVLGRERPDGDDHEAWNQRDAPWFRGADTEIRVISS